MKRLLILLTTVSFLSSCSSSAVASYVEPSKHSVAMPIKNTVSGSLKTALAAKNTANMIVPVGVMSPTLLQKQQRNAQIRLANELKISKAVAKVKKYVGKTWYVFSGATPSGWDCSGLVRWTYEQMGVTLEHSATKQSHVGKIVKTPVVGDIVAFYYRGSGRYSFHVGLYIGNGKMIHAYMPGTRTRIDSVKQVAKDNWAKFKFIRVLPQPALGATS